MYSIKLNPILYFTNLFKDISKITSLKQDTVLKILNEIEFKQDVSEDDLIEEKFFKEDNYIKKPPRVEKVFFNRLNIAYKSDSENINLQSLSDFKTLISEGKINEESIVFNNLIKTKKDYIEQWEVQLKNSWHKTLLI